MLEYSLYYPCLLHNDITIYDNYTAYLSTRVKTIQDYRGFSTWQITVSALPITV